MVGRTRGCSGNGLPVGSCFAAGVFSFKTTRLAGQIPLIGVNFKKRSATKVGISFVDSDNARGTLPVLCGNGSISRCDTRCIMGHRFHPSEVIAQVNMEVRGRKGLDMNGVSLSCALLKNTGW